MIIDPRIKVYGDLNYRNKKAPSEESEAITLVNQIRKHNPKTLLVHVKNEGKRTRNQVDMDKANGMQGGTSDFLIVGNPAFVCELKREDHTLSRWQPLQQEYLITASEEGCFACVAFGWRAGFQAYLDWYEITLANKNNKG